MVYSTRCLSFVCCAHSWDIELNTRREIPYLRTPICYSLFIFSKGSIVTEFKLILDAKDEHNAFVMLKEEIKDGNLGTLRVDPFSLERIPPTTTGDLKLPFLLFKSAHIGTGLSVLPFIFHKANFKLHRRAKNCEGSIFWSEEVNLWRCRRRTRLSLALFAKSDSLSPGPTTKPIVNGPTIYAIIIGVSFGGLFVLVLCIIFLVHFCKNRSAAYRGKRGSDNMPPDSQTYELKSVAVNNAYVSVKEISLGCDKQITGISNEGFHWYYSFSCCKRRICISFRESALCI